MVGDHMTADVCLLAEGTYPYVTGGVSAWVHDLVSSLPDIRFVIFHIGAGDDEGRKPVYRVPANVIDVADLGIHGGDEPKVAGRGGDDAAWAAARTIHEREPNGGCPVAPLIRAMASAPNQGINPHEMIYGKRAWELVRSLYEERAPHVPFLDYFWTWRFTHLPVARLLHASIPPARLYHAISAGWAGLAGAIARARTGRRLLLTEHGLYVRERRLDIEDADWIYEPREIPSNPRTRFFFKEQWSRLFDGLASIAYSEADLITTIFEGNRLAQIAAGADPDKTIVIPNGIDVERLSAIARIPAGAGEFRIGFVGRVVPVKDVRTFLRAVRIVADAIPGARAVVVGPTDEDAAYVEECRALVAALDLGRRVEFTGPRQIETIYPELDVVVLTSLSEAAPLVILEACAAGLPVVATDVGACRELLEGGRGPDDRALGASGFITSVGDPAATSAALITLARDPALGRKLADVGRTRVTRYYRTAAVVSRYREIYTKLLGD
jgi:glycosyltransferase involved in cell wall biosynthesis